MTTSNSINVKAREKFLAIQLFQLKGNSIGLDREGEAKSKFMAEDCLTKHFQVCVRRSCPTQLIRANRRHLRQVRSPRQDQPPHQSVCLRTWLPPSLAFH